ncbi:septum formation inhibitor Maf [Marinobacter panjinensis]|uniref:7-methyl-GTP pyrophosphatase n=1 Tax=Marinobacter panjinensis TaxID=2576384 RepID=A0A4U6R1B1_9GAMM|nr:nucleoside triphosphate pyrophosphatase [Marinobacter panjinensis]MCR8913891.1 Maf family nucleotide pyrophosphatase [Marinobacter panjinensis]TKV67474.1 septum formation inhibitor Maf [Marinobacter panjinensis]
MTPRPLLLASSSPYRRQLLTRLGLPFEAASPDIDESPARNETAEQLATRLAESKARALAKAWPGHWIIGSDQVACLEDGTLLNKPGNHECAVQQLARSSGQRVSFLTGLALLDASSGQIQIHCEPFHAHFRGLRREEIENYLHTEQPYDCAGSFKMEGLGIALFSQLEGRDPNSLVGLPLIALTDMLRNWGLNPLLQPPVTSAKLEP